MRMLQTPSEPEIVICLRELYIFTQAMRAAIGAPPEHEILARVRKVLDAHRAGPTYGVEPVQVSTYGDESETKRQQ